MTAGTDRPGKIRNGPRRAEARQSTAKERFKSSPFQRDGSPWGLGDNPADDTAKRKTGSAPARPRSPQIDARRERDPGPKGKARCGAWLGALALPERPDSANRYHHCLLTPRKDGAAVGGIPLPCGATPHRNGGLLASRKRGCGTAQECWVAPIRGSRTLHNDTADSRERPALSWDSTKVVIMGQS